MSEKPRPDPDGTEMVDLGDADVSAVDLSASPSTPGRERSVPPPLPPEVRASAPPPSAHLPPAPPPPRSNKFYALLIVGFVAVGVVVGLAFALGTRGEKKEVIVTTASSPSPAAPGSVMTLPTIDMNDDEGDAGK